MDVPIHKDWAHLKNLAKNRKHWRKLVRTLKNGLPESRVEVHISTKVPGASIIAHSTPKKRAKTKKKSKKQIEAEKLRTRKAHDALFNPTADHVIAAARTKNKLQKNRKNKIKKARPLSTKERQAAARAKWFETHDQEHVHTGRPDVPDTYAPRDIYADWPPTFTSNNKNAPVPPPQISAPLSTPPPPAKTPIPKRAHNDKMRRLRLLRRGRFKRKASQMQNKQPQPPAPIPATTRATPRAADHTPTHPQPDTSHDVNAPDTTYYPSPTNDMYSASMRRLSHELFHGPSPAAHPQQPKVSKTIPPPTSTTNTPPPSTTITNQTTTPSSSTTKSKII